MIFKIEILEAWLPLINYFWYENVAGTEWKPWLGRPFSVQETSLNYIKQHYLAEDPDFNDVITINVR